MATAASLYSAAFSVPWWGTDGVDNEMWTSFDNGGWIETGSYAGIGNPSTPTPLYFMAWQQSGTQGYGEVDFPNTSGGNPPIGAWYNAYLYQTYVGDSTGQWCASTAAANLGCAPYHFFNRTYANGAQVGMELLWNEASDPRPANWGYGVGAYVRSNGSNWETWRGATPLSADQTGSYRGFCHASNWGDGSIEFATTQTCP